MSYEWDVFLSYRRSTHWNGFVGFLADEIDGLLKTVVPRPSKMFYDRKQVPFGTVWPAHLADSLARSRVLIPLLWNEYFSEDETWCRNELSLMLKRAQAAPGAQQHHLIFPIVVFELDLPEELASLQICDLSDLANPHTKPGTSLAADIWKELKPFVQQVGNALDEVPDYDPQWKDLAGEEFWQLFSRKQLPQRELPSLRGDAA